MDLSYDDPERGRDLAARTREFVDEVVVPVERDCLGEGPVDEATIADLRETARDRGLYAPQVPEEYGGLGLSLRAALPVFEAAGRSLLGPAALRVDAPDEGNVHTLLLAGTDEQRERWVPGIVAGESRSAFAMTEPMDGGGSDPKALRTTARRDGEEWVIDGHKHWTTNGADADLFLVMARTDPDAHPYEGTSILLVPGDAPGLEVVREIPHLGGEVHGGSHAEVRFDGVRVPAEAVLGEVNEGFALAQRRLGPARLTHCMRFTGMADRALSIATAYADEREAFGGPVADKQGVRFEVARRQVDLHAARTMVRHAADRIAAGERASVPVAACKYFAAEAAQEAVDTAVQVCGGQGIGKDLPLADFYEDVRAFRVVDGADEVHLRTVARAAFEDPPAEELDVLARYGEFDRE
jgi:acyl-CoA dehydrogenase